MRSLTTVTVASLCVACLAAFTGCTGYVDHLRYVRGEFYNNRLDVAEKRVADGLKSAGKDRDAYKLEQAMIHLATGKPAEAERTFREVRDSFDHLEQTSLAENAWSMVTDDTRRAYAGEDYERILLRAFLAVSNLMHDGGDAAAYSLQVAQKQEQIVLAAQQPDGQNPKLAYKRVAFGAYLNAALAEATHQRYDDVARNLHHVVSWEPTFAPGQHDLQRAVYGRHSEPGNGVLYVITLVGKGPYKEEVEELPSTVALLVADRILSATGKHTLPPTVAPILVPKVMVPFNSVKTVQVAVNNQPVGTTATITDVGQFAVQQYEAVYPQVMGRAIARRVVKKGVVYAGKEVVGVSKHSWSSLLMDVGGVVWEATENADTRCWGLLPNQIQLLRVELPAGTHQLGLTASDGAIALGNQAQASVNITNGGNTYVLANFPAQQLVGQVLTSSR